MTPSTAAVASGKRAKTELKIEEADSMMSGAMLVGCVDFVVLFAWRLYLVFGLWLAARWLLRRLRR